jgi:hypothetical protein
VSRRLGTRPAKPLTLAKVDVERSPERGPGDLAVSLHAVAVADGEQCARHVNAQVQRRSRDEVLVVQVATVPAGWPAGDTTAERRRCDANRAEERRKSQRDSGLELHVVGAGPPSQQTEMRIRKVVGEHAAAGVEGDDAKGMEELDYVHKEENVMRFCLVPLFMLLSAAPTQGQTGPCTESAIKQGKLPAADDVFSYMPPYGKPVVGKTAIQAANVKSFSDRTNVTRTWAGDHRIAASPSGDMAYEYGTVRMGYDEGGKRTEFEAVILTVYKAKNGVCETAALTMHPLEEQPKR